MTYSSLTASGITKKSSLHIVNIFIESSIEKKVHSKVFQRKYNFQRKRIHEKTFRSFICIVLQHIGIEWNLLIGHKVNQLL